MELDVAVRQEGDFAVVAVAGELDVYTAPKLEKVLTELIAGGSVNVVVDLGGVSFLDSTGLGAMVKGLKRAKEAGGTLQVVASDERVVKVFRITGLDAVMSLQGDLDAVLGA
ncbi:MAG: STAS domain-containing protein [Actinobacteria bacterium]|nr:STAS domain-containing protein [Actinomycetota bacterium]